MTRVNFDFTRDVCYQAAAHLDESLREGRPAGLKELGPWGTLYQGLSVMPEPAGRSWHAFDHFYSDRAFPALCERMGANPPARLLDIGCNTGKWAQLCLSRLPALQVGLVDLPPQLERARARLEQAGLAERAQLHPTDLLDPDAALPAGYDLIWMSQFLDCFSRGPDRRHPAQGACRAAAARADLDPRAVLGPAAFRGRGLQPAADFALLQLRCQRQQPDVRFIVVL